MSNTPAVPDGLGEHGLALWKAITADLELRADEVSILDDACRTADRIAQMRDELQGAPMTTTGSMGQIVVHPLVAELRSHEAHKSQLMAKLKIVEGASISTQTGERSSSAREAARAKWQTPHGKAS